MQPLATRPTLLTFHSLLNNSWLQCRLLGIRPNHTSQTTGQSASDKLFADAAREEREDNEVRQKSPRLRMLENQSENWDGDEKMEDAVLRMLMDKYKPLRSGTIQSAEQKLKQAPPKVLNASEQTAPSMNLQPTTGSWETESLLPSSEDHRPWHTQYKAPSHDMSSIKLARLPPPVSSSQRAKKHLEEEISAKQSRGTKIRTKQAVRVGQAKESTLDYRLGVHRSKIPTGRPNPVGVKGWQSLTEERIETARQAGLFKNIKGRGKPITRTTEEYNPFIGRDEFLMNRIIQRNNTAPPWVEIQGELDSALSGFRMILRQSWIRRAVRILTTRYSPEILRKFTLGDIQALHLRDPDWVQREESYHELAIEEINSLVRKYNGIAPYAVRRPYYMRTVELERVFDSCPEEIWRALQEKDRDPRLEDGRGSGGSIGRSAGTGSSGNGGGEGGVPSSDSSWGVGEIIRGMVGKIASRWKGG